VRSGDFSLGQNIWFSRRRPASEPQPEKNLKSRFSKSHHIINFNIMSSNNYQTPDLATVLRTLAGLTPQNQQHAAKLSTQDQSSPLPTHIGQSEPEVLQKIAAPSVSYTCMPSATQKIIDPATIIDWASGLRCVMKTVAKHEKILHEIRRVGSAYHLFYWTS